MRLLSLFASATLLALSYSAPVAIAPTVSDAVPNQYNVMFTSGIDRAAFDTAMNLVNGVLGAGHRVMHQHFFSDFRGFTIEAPMSVMNIIQNMAGVEMIEPNYIMHEFQFQLTEQRDCTYGLDRISHRTNAGEVGRTPYAFDYYAPAGRGTTIYVVDSGIFLDHNDFGGRASKGENYAPNNVNGNPNDFTDYTGHGTHVASIAAGFDYGVAKSANIVDVKIINDNGTTDVGAGVAGIGYAANEAQSRGDEARSVINMSFGYGTNSATNVIGFAVRSATNAGVLCVAAAGNDAVNADYSTPASVPESCTVGAIGPGDGQTSFSNYGDSLDIWAPGLNIPAAGIANPTEIVNMSGTSMSAPYVAGIAAYLKSEGSTQRYTTYQPIEFCQELSRDGTQNEIAFFDYAQPSGPNSIVYDLSGN